MTTLAEYMIVARADNRPPMLQKTMYNSWQIHMLLYIKGKEHDRMMLNSVLNGPLVYGTIEVDGVTRPKTYIELTDQEKLQDDCDVRATSIVLQGLSPDVYSLVSHHNVYFREGLQPEWSKFVTDFKLERNMHTSNYDKLYAYLSQHEAHATEVRLMRERFLDLLALYQPLTTPSIHQNSYQSLVISQPPQAEFPQTDSDLAIPSFLLGDDPIASLNKAMAFLSTAITSCFPTTNNQLRTSSNPRNQATSQDGRVTVQQVQGRQGQSFAGMGSKSNATSSVINKNGENNAAIQARVVRCYNFQGEGHMASQVLDEEQLAFLADPGVAESQDTHITMTHNAAFQTDDLDAIDSDCDEAPSTKAVLMANLFSYDSDIISEISTQVAKCNAESLLNKNVNETLTVELERYKERVKMFEDRQKVDLNSHENYIDSQMNDMILNRNAMFTAFQKDIDTLKLTLSKNIKENKSLITAIKALKKQTKEREDKYIKEEIDLEKQKKELENIVYKVGQSAQTMHMLTKPQVFYDDTHKQALGYQNLFYLKKAQRIKPMLYDDQAFWLPISNPIFEQLVVPHTPVKTEVPSELPKDFDNDLHNELIDVKMVFNQMEAVVEQCSVDKKCFEIQKKELLLENNRLLELIISQDLVHTVVNTLAAITDYESMRKRYCEKQNRNLTLEVELSKMNDLLKTCSRLQNHCISLELKLQQNKESFQNNRSCSHLDALAFNKLFVINDLKAQLQAKESSISKLRAYIAKLKGKNVFDNNVLVNNASVIALGMFRLDLEPLSSKLKNHREAHEDYLKKTKEHTNTLCGIVEQARKLNPSDPYLEYACKFKIRVQELLVFVSETCPRMKSSTSDSGSQPSGNTKKNRISQTTNSNQKNKVEDHLGVLNLI
ncbi:hypothetical protein Tco_0079283 [Tanacetum coccineum]